MAPPGAVIFQHLAIGGIGHEYRRRAVHGLGLAPALRVKGVACGIAGPAASYTLEAPGPRKTKTVNGTTTVFVTDAANREVLEYDVGRRRHGELVRL